MRSIPKAVAFDIIGTTFSLEPVRDRLTALGLPAKALELWFAIGLRDAFAIAAADGFEPFKRVLEDALDQVLFTYEWSATAAQKKDVLHAMGELPAYPDAADAFRILREAGIGVLALSNGAKTSTQALLDRAGLSDLVDEVVSVDAVKRSKPRPEVYRRAADGAGVAPGALALVATHAWDVHGAKQAGLMAGFVARGQPFPSVMRAPDVVGQTLSDVARYLAHPT